MRPTEKSKRKPKPTDTIDENGEDSADLTAALTSIIGPLTKNLYKIKLGSGIVGKLAPITIYTVMGLVVLALAAGIKGGLWYLAGGMGLLAFSAFVYGVHQMVGVTKTLPGHALLEGGELLTYQEREIQLIAKTLSAEPQKVAAATKPSVPAIEPPQQEAPLLSIEEKE